MQGGVENKKVLALKEVMIHFHLNIQKSNAQGGIENKCRMNDAEKGRARKSHQGEQKICFLRLVKDF